MSAVEPLQGGRGKYSPGYEIILKNLVGVIEFLNMQTYSLTNIMEWR